MKELFTSEQLAYFGGALLFLIFFIMTLLGKGGMLIAGYNTASKEKKQNTMKRNLFLSQALLTLFVLLL